MSPDLHNDTGLVPLLGVGAVLLLDENVVADFERWELTGAVGQSLLHVKLPLTVGFCSLVSREPPVLSGDKLAGLEWQGVTENTAEDHLGRAETSDGAGRVPVDQQGLENLVGVKTAGLRSVAPEDSLGVFDGQFRPLVGSGMIC